MQEVLNSTDFGSKVLESEGRVLVEFFATWCPPLPAHAAHPR